RQFRGLNVLDDFNREGLGIDAEGIAKTAPQPDKPRQNVGRFPAAAIGNADLALLELPIL
ncbi:hypothetical protein, partial [Paracoccus sp. (in: a-proteobacteria)]|uniref:hypothetical protein n=1 Tax=Paracoccus sp. TaxID=267 RepID=UPI0028B1A63F